ncbi:hypothetical protein BT63DRAFT_153204 [Microthyrium microscopicum]|uniref:Uncharacterized protein n=1 Tax=Microthyrium microscopicum TaxID=703497 RepID=A0A6A6UNF5_9PEZI|nr:hypothetical protein BT63DRAFT_153204 [Microthyrium microscopicum]
MLSLMMGNSGGIAIDLSASINKDCVMNLFPNYNLSFHQPSTEDIPNYILEPVFCCQLTRLKNIFGEHLSKDFKMIACMVPESTPDPQPTIMLEGPSGSDNIIYLTNGGQRQPLFTVQFDISHKPNVRLSRSLPAPQPGQQLTQFVGTAEIGQLSEAITLNIHGREIKNNETGSLSTGYRKDFVSPFPSALGAGVKMRWKDTSSSRGLELWNEDKKVKVARFMPHLLSKGDPELLMFLPIRNADEEHFLDLVVLMAMAQLAKSKINNKVGGQIFKTIMGLPGVGS